MLPKSGGNGFGSMAMLLDTNKRLKELPGKQREAESDPAKRKEVGSRLHE